MSEQLRVFDEHERSYLGPALQTESIYDWLDRSASPEAAAARAYVEDLYSSFPDESGHLRDSLRATTSPTADNDFYAAMGSLYMYRRLGSPSNCRVDEQVSGNNRRPDIQVLTPEQVVSFTTEVTAVCPNPEWAASDWRVAQLADAIEEALVRDRFDLAIWPEGLWTEDAPADALVEAIRRGMAELPPPAEVEETYRSVGALPGFDFEFPGCAGRIEFLPLDEDKVSARPDDDRGRIVGAQMNAGGATNTVPRLRNKIRDKHPSRYPAELETASKPYVVAIVNVDHFCDVQDIVDALFGEELVVYYGTDIENYYQMRSRDGALVPNEDGTIRNRAYSGMLFVDGLKSEMFGLGSAKLFFVANPHALCPMSPDPFSPDHALLPVVDGRMEWQPPLPEERQ